ncbi:MAG: hypothetical protein SH850_27485 [Planctomycetaceae bacterium]|nr:hypothetical protein [Planctomycetaceae bacterium]
MLIYCARLSLVPSSPVSSLMAVTAEWLRSKTHEVITENELAVDGERRAKDGSSVEWLAAMLDGEEWRGVRYAHPDRQVEGRQWVTEIGVRRAKAVFACSILLRTHEVSASVDPNVQTTRPKLVEEIVKRCKLAADTCGGAPRTLRLDDAEAFLYEVNNPDRQYPLVQISPTLDGNYLIGPERAASQLAGVAVVAVIPPDVDTYALEETLSLRFSSYRGAVNIIWPKVGVGAAALVPTYRILDHQIAEIRARGGEPEKKLLASLCHRMNEVYARDHITPEMVRSIKHRAALADARQSAANTDPDMESLVRQVDEDQRAEIESLKAKLKARDGEIATLEEKLGESETTVESLKASLAAKTGQVASAPDSALPAEARDALHKAMGKDAGLFDALKTLTLLFPDRIIVLGSAWKSARDADEFKYPRKAYDMLHTLCSDYWEAMANGKSDAEARSCLGQAFSAKESETVERNKNAKKLRTFRYKDNPMEMMMHIKIGNKDSVADTFRAHFEWDGTCRKVVIGHCGKHLDHK